MSQNITLVCFSPTGNTLKILTAMAGAISPAFDLIDLTKPGPVSRTFGPQDLVLFGMPVYSGRVPAVARARLAGIESRGASCLAVVSYGNRDFDDALLELADWAAEAGFAVKGAAAVIGRHTYGKIQVGRPGAEDLAQCADFARRAAARAPDSPAPVIPGNRPYREGGSGGKFRPLTSEDCLQCGLCAADCPVQAIADDFRTISDSCLACFRCVRNCPVQAKQPDPAVYGPFAEMFSEKLRTPRTNSFFL